MVRAEAWSGGIVTRRDSRSLDARIDYADVSRATQLMQAECNTCNAFWDAFAPMNAFRHE